eukprot:Tamp_14483.p1 GENE.Tamp_14483~~Tamp_14483.p1  ORF type:complete len:497 (+),score=89.71 Tamp_14483:2-1492(+)
MAVARLAVSPAGIFLSVSLLVTPASGFVAALAVALQQPGSTALLRQRAFPVALGRSSPSTERKALLRMASSRSPQRDAAPWGDAAQWSTLQRLVKEREAKATRIRKICARTLDLREQDEVAGPRHLIVLAHGLMGGTSDLSFLRDSILEADPQDTHVLLSATNQDKTTDGIAVGGSRLASEILDTVEAMPSLTHISLLGNSLGGLYSRYAAAVLYTPPPPSAAQPPSLELICGLKPHKFVTTASPHLGVRRFTYVPVPEVLHPLSTLFVGRTGEDLFLADGNQALNPALFATSERADRSEQTKTSLEQQTETRRATGEAKEPAKLYIMATHEAFLGALAAFEQRRAYFNLQGDALVPVGSAAFVVSPRAAGWGLLEKPVSDEIRARSSPVNDPLYPEIECILEVPPSTPGAPLALQSADESDRDSMLAEADMARSLDALGWTKVGVRFQGVLPLAHNKIVALTGAGLIRDLMNPLWMEGRDTMRHCAAFLVRGQRP